MTDTETRCPQCGGELRFRLGELECTVCSFKVTPEAKEEKRPAPVKQSRFDGIGGNLSSQSAEVPRGTRRPRGPSA